MKTSHLFLLLFLAATAIGQSNSDNGYKLVEDEDGIIVEVFDNTNVDENRYKYNNSIYKVGNRFTYCYEHLSQNNKIKYFSNPVNEKKWEFVDFDKIDSNTIQTLVIEVGNGNPMAAFIKDYDQTALLYWNGKDKNYTMSGAVENEANI